MNLNEAIDKAVALAKNSGGETKEVLKVVLTTLEDKMEEIEKLKEVPFHKYLLDENERLEKEPRCTCVNLIQEYRMTGKVSSQPCVIHDWEELNKAIETKEELEKLQKLDSKLTSRRVILNKLLAAEQELTNLRWRNHHLEELMEPSELELDKLLTRLKLERDEAKATLQERLKIQSEMDLEREKVEVESKKLKKFVEEMNANSTSSIEAALNRVAEVVNDREELIQDKEKAYDDGIQAGINMAADKIMDSAKVSKEGGFTKGAALLTVVATEVLTLSRK